MAVFTGNGSAGAPSFTFSSDTDTGIYRPAAGILGFALDSNLRFAINGNAGATAAIFSSTTTPRTNYAGQFGNIVANVQVEQAIGYIGVISNYDNTTFGTPGELILGRTGATSLLSNTAVASGNWLGMISFQGADGTNMQYASRIRGIADGTIGASQMPGTMIFETTPAASATPAEVLRITSNKYLRLASGTGGIQFNGDTAAANALDDYEEGVYVMRLFDAATGGNESASTYTAQYTKIGRLVTVSANAFNINTTGLTAGNTLYFSLPFASGNLTGNYGIGSVALDSITFTGIPVSLVPGNVSRGFIYDSNSGGANGVVTAGDVLDDVGDIYINLTYISV
jgi:hypothetical protein